MNSHFFLVLVTPSSSDNSLPISGLLPGLCFPENTLVWAGYRSAHHPRSPLVNPLAALWPFPRATTAALLSSVRWASCQGAGSGEPIPSHHRPHKELSTVQFLYSWLDKRLSRNRGDFLVMWEILHVHGKRWSNYVLYMPPYKLCGFSCPDSPRKWTFYAL